jgi:hypothetical protein
MEGRTTAPPPALATLDVAISSIPGSGRYPAIEESSIIVSDPKSEERYVVQVIVNPRVSGSFLDPKEPTAEFQAKLAHDTRRALESSRYMAVTLCRKAEPSAPLGLRGAEEVSSNGRP